MSALSRQPWPMKWIALGIILFIIPYSYLTLHYRKRTPAYLPYEDTRERIRAGHAGYQRIVGSIERPADPPQFWVGTTGALAAGGLPEPLRTALGELLLLPADIGRVKAAAAADHLAAYPVEFACTLADNRQQPEGVQFYVKDDALLIVPTCERLAGALIARTREAVIVATAPPGSLPPGQYQVTLVGRLGSRAWTLQVH